MGSLAACGFAPSSPPPNVVVAPAVPAAWVAPAATAGAAPAIVGARFSSLDVELGQDWTGDIVTSSDVRSVVLHTNLWDVVTHREAPGRFHFIQHVIDDPAFIVRPYALDIEAIGPGDRTTTLVVPFRLRGHGAA